MGEIGDYDRVISDTAVCALYRTYDAYNITQRSNRRGCHRWPSMSSLIIKRYSIFRRDISAVTLILDDIYHAIFYSNLDSDEWWRRHVLVLA